ncbi:MAG: archease [Candidatus Omnitrophica bacterium]|nr:archease [Candidatus Omnitrophota bacterium]
MKTYSFLEHTADIAIRVKARTLKTLFKNAALAMFDIMAEKKTRHAREKVLYVTVKADSLEDLLARWLNDLLSLSSAKSFICSRIKIESVSAQALKAKVFARGISAYRLRTEIKAVTYHELSIRRRGSLWTGKVVFDV